MNKLYFNSTIPTSGYEIFICEGQKTTNLRDLVAAQPLRQVSISTRELLSGTYFMQAWGKTSGQVYRATLIKP
ncbi:MAG TPA: hypothetical protein PLC89_16825 [Haliscomenobacter sp.]|uniref:hypothetical protein n=1 Tax=Haliscomenobacter sp. TaxID=2717303 RepID=UPI002B6F4518|nr:hypothetical protein [Haliscomenobacter sp.]HOY18971.1 hypothetical protein [Haliscomenobacter sp.]